MKQKSPDPPGRQPGLPRPERDPAPESADDSESPPPLATWEAEGGAVVEAPEPTGEPVAPEPGLEEYKDRWLRAEAELQNFRRRARRDLEESQRAAEESVLLELVHALDDLERALESAQDSGAAASWLQGLVVIAQRLRDYLGRRGVSIVNPIGEPFDPAFHEALLQIDPPPETAPGSVVQVVHKGYRRGSRALRPARVVVARHPREG